MFVTVVGDSVTVLPTFVCARMAVVMGGSFFTMSLLKGLITYERYVTFFRPLTYSKYFTVTKMVLTSILLHSCGQSFSIVLQLVTEMKLIATALVCKSKGQGLKWANPLVVIVFQVPPAVFSIFVMIRLRLLLSRSYAAKITTNNNSVARVNQNKEQALSVRKAIKMISLVSGSFWFTSIPALLLRTALGTVGYQGDFNSLRVGKN